MNYEKAAGEILSAIGGKENLVSAVHCATRLRLVIRDNKQVQLDKLEKIDGLKGVFEGTGQLQIIIGAGAVNKVYEEFTRLTEEGEADGDESENESVGKKENQKMQKKQELSVAIPWYKRIIRILGDIFIPIIPAIIATGLLNGLLGGLSGVYPAIADSNIYGLLKILSNTALTFLPVLIGISAARCFGGSIFLGAVIGMVMIHPDLVNAWSVESGAKTATLFSWFGMWDIQNTGYQGHVIPVIIAVWFMCKIEGWVHKRVPEILDLFVTPFVTVLVTGFVTLTIIGPVFAQLESWVLYGAKWLISIPFGIGAFFMGAVYAPTVVTGVHHMYNAIELMMVAENGRNIWMPIATAANVSQAGAALAVALKTKSKSTKSVAFPASLSAFMGITEPAIFRVNLRYTRPFIAAMIGGAVGAACGSLLGVYATANGVTGLFGFLITTESFWGYLITFFVASVVAFLFAWIFGIKEETEVLSMTSPLSGKLIALEQVPDITFAKGILGPGAAIEPVEGKVTAPDDGEVIRLLASKHAIALKLKNGLEILIHVGINTVELEGKGFTAHVKEGDPVKRNQTLITFDKEMLEQKGYAIVTPVIVMNYEEYEHVSLSREPAQNVGIQDTILHCKKK